MTEQIDLVELLSDVNTLSELFAAAKDKELGVEQLTEVSGIRPILAKHDEYVILGKNKLSGEHLVIHAYNTGVNYKLKQGKFYK